jgi:PilZ domain
MKLRYCERVETHFPVIFSGDCYVDEGTVINVSVPGCEVLSKRLVAPGSYLEMKVLVPDNASSLCVGLARVCWSDGHRFGVEFIRMPGYDQVRLGRLVKKHRALRSPARLRPT